MRSLAEARWIKEGTEGDEKPVYEKEKVWILHFGLKYNFIRTDDNKVIAVNYTVAICEDCVSGKIRCFLPEELRILGDENKEVMEIRLTVLGEPKAQARHRHFTRGTFSGTYDPSKDKKESFASILQSQAPKEPISAPISLELVFCMSRPRNHYGSGKKSEMLKDSAPEVHSGRPDLDNLTKFVQDSLNKIFYHDDALIYELKATKIYSDRSRTEIKITTL